MLLLVVSCSERWNTHYFSAHFCQLCQYDNISAKDVTFSRYGKRGTQQEILSLVEDKGAEKVRRYIHRYSFLNLIFQRDSLGRNVLHILCRYGRVDLVSYVLDKQLPIHPMAADAMRQRPLDFACGFGHLECALLLLRKVRFYVP